MTLEIERNDTLTTSVSDRDQQSYIGLMGPFFQLFTLPSPDWSGKTRIQHLSPSSIEFEFMSFLYEPRYNIVICYVFYTIFYTIL